jgi:hypothetical protein
VLAPVVITASALDVSTTGDRDDHFLFWNQVLISHSALKTLQDLGSAVITEAVHDVLELF